MRPIDADKLIEEVEELNAIGFYELQDDSREAFYEIRTAIKNAPTITADRPQGRWIRTAGEYIGDDVSGFYDYHWACSECEREAIINDWNIYELSDYCPHCGARMEGANDE